MTADAKSLTKQWVSLSLPEKKQTLVSILTTLGQSIRSDAIEQSRARFTSGDPDEAEVDAMFRIVMDSSLEVDGQINRENIQKFEEIQRAIYTQHAEEASERESAGDIPVII